LSIESDVTSKTALDAYEALGVPEVWIYSNSKLKVYIFDRTAERNRYIEINSSPTFPNVPIIELIPKLVNQAISLGTSRMLRSLKSEL